MVKTEASENGSHQAESTENRSDFAVQPLISLSGTGKGELQFISDDWSDYADLSKLPRRSGVTSGLLRQLVVKELTDNALDECDRVNRPGQSKTFKDGINTYTVTDEGEGLNGTPQQIAEFFSLRRPKATSKLWRLPKRGAVGNGIRVIVGAVASGGGRIIIETRGQRIVLRPQAHNGFTAVEQLSQSERIRGSSITIELNPACPHDSDELFWAHVAIKLASHGHYTGIERANPHWLDLDHFCEMLRSITPGTTLRDFTAKLDGCTSSASRKRITEKFGLRRLCMDLPKTQAAELLKLLQSIAKPVKAKYLPLLGKTAWNSQSYSKFEGEFVTGDHFPKATIPFVAECWATAIGRRTNDIKIGAVTINRSPAIGESNAQRYYGRMVYVNLCGSNFDINSPEGQFTFSVNITSPFVPIVSEGKMPDLSPFRHGAKEAIQLALRRASKYLPAKPKAAKVERPDDHHDEDEEEDDETPERISQRETIWDVLPEAAERSRAGGFQFSLRSLYYRARILVKNVIGTEPSYTYFASVVTDYENDEGEIQGMIRDTRGVYVEPHGGELKPLGTASVDAYSRPPWSYSNILFLEKEDLVSALKQSGFYERWDCFALSSKGFGSRAARDLIDKIAEAGKDEPTKCFSVHDADASGSLISQALSQKTRARAARSIEVIDIGLFPWTALKDGLLSEAVPTRKKKAGYWKSTFSAPVADYIKKRDEDNEKNGNPDAQPNWEEWLQKWRVELNAMTTQEFVAWMNAQFEKHGASKTVPPGELALQRISEIVKNQLALDAGEVCRDGRQTELDHLHEEMAKITEELQKQVDKIEEEIDEETEKLTAERIANIELPTASDVLEKIQEWLKDHAHFHWTNSIDSVAHDFIQEQRTFLEEVER